MEQQPTIRERDIKTDTDTDRRKITTRGKITRGKRPCQTQQEGGKERMSVREKKRKNESMVRMCVCGLRISS